jgi:hypothetical protein
MKMDESFDGRSCQEDWNSYVSVPDRDDLSRTVAKMQALIHEGQALVIAAGRGPIDGVNDQESSSHGTGNGTRASSTSALMASRETQTIHESPRDSGATAAIPVLESPQVTAVEMGQIRNVVAEEIIASTETSSTQKAAENILHTSSSQVKEPEPPKNVQDRDFMAPSASKVPSYIEMNQTLSLGDTGSVQQYCIGTTRQGRDCKDTAERGSNFCSSHSLPVATLVQCAAVSKVGTRCANAARKGATHCGKHLPEREALIDTIHQCRGFSTRGNRCENAAKKGQLFCGGRHLPSTTTVTKSATPSKAIVTYGRNGMPPTAIPATKTIAINQMCVGPSCRDMAKKGSHYCRQHASLPGPVIPMLVTTGGCVAITKTGKQCVDPAIRGASYCFNHHHPRPKSGVCAAVTKTGKLCVDPTVGGALFCYNHRHLAVTSLVAIKNQTAPPRTGLVQTAAVNNGGQLLAALINCLPQQVCDGIPTGGRATRTAGVGRSPHQCQGLTEAGKRCKDTAKENRPFCGRHSTDNNPVGAEDVMMSQLMAAYIDVRLDSMTP